MNSKLTKCRVCGEQVASTAQQCPHCGVKWPTTKQLIGITLSIIITVIMCVVIIVSIVTSSPQTRQNTNHDSSSGTHEESAPTSITLETFEACTQGMTYDECCEVIGLCGTLSSETTLMDSTIQTYSWKGNGGIGSSAALTFTDGVLTNKMQIALK